MLKAHVEIDIANTNLEWCQLDDLIKMWILGSLSDSLQEQVVTTSGNAKALWDHLKDLFYDNKDARAINLDNELRSVKIGKMLVNEYCTKIKSMANRHKNLDCEVSEKNMVIYAVNGLDLRFATLVEIIRHPLRPQQSSWPPLHPMPKSATGPGTMAQSVPHQQPQPTSSAHQPVVYMAQRNSHVIPNQPNTNGNGILGPSFVFYASQPTALPSAFSTMSLQDLTWNMDTGATSHLNSNAPNLSTLFNKRLFSSIHVGNDNLISVTSTGHTIIPSYHRPLHLHNVLVTPNIIKNLISVRQFTRDNNCTIEFDAFGFSVNDFLTRHILFQCDSSGDLYPVTKPSTLPATFVSTSSTTWQQRLSHPGDEVLRSLSSRQFIFCNKVKSTHVCHACQLGFPTQSVGFSNIEVLELPCLLVLITRTSQSRQHGKSESDSYYLSD
nr:hybrid signal transduction histidine kinase M [Tanacetum cinerariifolium]